MRLEDAVGRKDRLNPEVKLPVGEGASLWGAIVVFEDAMIGDMVKGCVQVYKEVWSWMEQGCEEDVRVWDVDGRA